MSIQQYQANLFPSREGNETIVFKDDGLDAVYRPEFLPKLLAQAWFEQLLQNTVWKQDVVTVYGKRHLAPRLSCWMGEPWMSYVYSQQTMQPVAWQSLPLAIKEHIERANGVKFNSVLINYYRDGQDSNGWHADDEPELGCNPTIASLSLGAPRDFHLRQKSNHANKHKLNLVPGSLLIMRGDTQTYWQHQVPKRVTAAPRINLTFRTMINRSV